MLKNDSMTINMVIKTKTNKYWVAPEVEETSVTLIEKLINSGDFVAEFIPAIFTSNSTGTLIIMERG